MSIKESKEKGRQTGIEKLEEIRTFYLDQIINQFQEENQMNRVMFTMIDWFMVTVINTFKEFEGKRDKVRRQADDNWRTLEYHTDYLISNDRKIKILDKRVKKLRKQYNEGKGKEIKVGGTD